MRRFSFTIVMCAVLAAAVPFTGSLAVSASSPAYTHWAYMLGHAGWLHYAINAWALLVVHNLLRWYRVLAAYLMAVAESYVMLPDEPMVGLSVFTCFFIGFSAPWLWRLDRLAVLQTAALLILTCIMPGFAGIPHVASFASGVAFCFCEGWVRGMKDYLK